MKVNNTSSNSIVLSIPEGSAQLTEFPGNECQIGIFHNVYIKREHRGKGIGSKFHKHRLEAAKRYGYSTVICTVNVDNVVELRILEKNNWINMGKLTDTSYLFKKDLT